MGYAVGWHGTVATTTDGGASWGLRAYGEHNLRTVVFHSPDSGIALGNRGIVLSTVDGGGVLTATEPARPTGVATTIALHPARPNPFNPATTVTFDIPGAAHVKLAIYDLRGRRIAVLVDGFLRAGSHALRWEGAAADGRPAASGIYLCRLQSGRQLLTRKLVLIR